VKPRIVRSVRKRSGRCAGFARHLHPHDRHDERALVAEVLCGGEDLARARPLTGLATRRLGGELRRTSWRCGGHSVAAKVRSSARHSCSRSRASGVGAVSSMSTNHTPSTSAPAPPAMALS
jgi:hypothetical protein